MLNTIAFVPVRGGSKGIPHKNIKNFCGKPLLYWVVNELCKTKEIDKVVLATDSKDIKDIAASFKLPKLEIYNRQEKNAKDNSATEDVVLEYIEFANLRNEITFILAQVTSPFTRSRDFSEAIELLKNNNYDSLLSVSVFKRFLWNHLGNPINYDYKNRPRRQDFNEQYLENGAFYINSVKNIKKYHNRLSGKIGLYMMPEYTSVEIDEPIDWIIAEAIMKELVLKEVNHKSKKLKIKLFVTDIDGVLTDSGMYYSENGDELKKFNTKDGKAFELLRKAGIKTGMLTSENTKLNARRANKLKVDFIVQGVKDKLNELKKIALKYNIDLEEIAYIGDDINDINVLKNVGFAACPSDAVFEVKQVTDIIILNNKGGDGVVREFVEKILNDNY